MTDSRVRELERKSAVGDDAAALAHLRELERAGQVVWIAQHMRDSSSMMPSRDICRGPHKVCGVYWSLGEAVKDQVEGGRLRLRPNDRLPLGNGNCTRRWSDQPPEGWGAYLWGGHAEYSVSVLPFKVGSRFCMLRPRV